MKLNAPANETVEVTVGICVKNSEGLIKKALEGVISQDFPHDKMELIVVDGNSRDKTIQVLKEILVNTDLKFRILYENSGLGPARQMVVDEAAGKYIVWVDADVILSKSYILNQVAFMNANPEVGIVAGKYDVYVGQGIVADLESIIYSTDSEYGERGSSKVGYLPGAEGAIYRTQAIRETGGFDLNIKGAAEDTEVAYRIHQSGWDIAKTDQLFAESTRPTWLSLWDQYVWYGRGCHYIFHKNCDSVSVWKLSPIAGFIAGLLRLPRAYLITHKLSMFLLPVHYGYKRVAWFYGFLAAHLKGYGHFKN